VSAPGVPWKPSPADLRRLRSGKRTSGDHGRRWCNEVNFLATVPQPVCSSLIRSADTVAQSVEFFYARSIGVQVLKLVVALESLTLGGSGTVEVTLPAGAAWLNANGLDGSVALTAGRSGLQSYGSIEALVDVSGMTAGSLSLFTVTCTPYASNTLGIYRIHAAEVALASVDPTNYPTDDRGANPAWCIPPGKLHDGGASVGDGFGRLFSESDYARQGVKRHWQVLFREQRTAIDVFTASTSFTGLAMLSGLYEATWYLRAFRPFKTTDGYAHTFAVRYKTTSATKGGEIKLVLNSADAVTLTCPATNGAWATASGTCTVPANNTDQLVITHIKGRVPTGDGTNDKVMMRAAALISNGA
jgi:hypothetical protein